MPSDTSLGHRGHAAQEHLGPPHPPSAHTTCYAHGPAPLIYPCMQTAVRVPPQQLHPMASNAKGADAGLYDFPLPPNLTEAQQDARRQSARAASSSEQAWNNLSAERLEKVLKSKSGSTRKELCRSGVPPSLRPRVWMEASGARAMRVENGPDYYASLLSASGATSAASRQIELVRSWACAIPCKWFSSACVNGFLSLWLSYSTYSAHKHHAVIRRGES